MTGPERPDPAQRLATLERNTAEAAKHLHRAARRRLESANQRLRYGGVTDLFEAYKDVAVALRLLTASNTHLEAVLAARNPSPGLPPQPTTEELA